MMLSTDADWRTMEQETEQLIAVDEHDHSLGPIEKQAAHRRPATRHRAISVFLNDEAGNTLLAQRSEQKPLWPLWWDGACSSHQWYPAEPAVATAQRRLPFELGIDPNWLISSTEVGKYTYRAQYSLEWEEWEWNYVVVARVDSKQMSLQLNPREVATTEWVSATQIQDRLDQSSLMVPWFAQAWQLAADLWYR